MLWNQKTETATRVMKHKMGRGVRQKQMTTMMTRYQRGWQVTLAGSNETIKLELPRAWEPLDSSKPLQPNEGSSSHGIFFYGSKIG